MLNSQRDNYFISKEYQNLGNLMVSEVFCMESER
nr:MAG TPA: hypothetical protein [Caudoviricetes sp.]